MTSALAPDARSLDDSRHVLDAALEETLLTGRGPHGETWRLRTLEHWLDAWGRWRAVVMPKAKKHLPGRRPFACYVVGEIPPRPLLQVPPLDVSWFRLYVTDDAGGGQWHYEYPQPYQRPERWHLSDLGIVTLEELKKYRPLTPADIRRLYPWEAGQASGAPACWGN